MNELLPLATPPRPAAPARAPAHTPAHAPAAPLAPATAEGAGAPLGSPARQQIDERFLGLRLVPAEKLDQEVGARIARIVPARACMSVQVDHACAGLDPLGPRLHGNLAPALRAAYASVLVERDPLLLRASQEWRALLEPVEEHQAWLRASTRHTEAMQSWLERAALAAGRHIAVVPARGWLSRGALYVFLDERPADTALFTLFYAAQRLAVALDLRERPYIAELNALRFTARELDVLRAGLMGAGDDETAARMGLSVDAIRYYYKKFKHKVPPTLGHLKPRELARILHQLGKL
jgi:hypothetical protein